MTTCYFFVPPMYSFYYSLHALSPNSFICVKTTNDVFLLETIYTQKAYAQAHRTNIIYWQYMVMCLRLGLKYKLYTSIIGICRVTTNLFFSIGEGGMPLAHIHHLHHTHTLSSRCLCVVFPLNYVYITLLVNSRLVAPPDIGLHTPLHRHIFSYMRGHATTYRKHISMLIYAPQPIHTA